MEAIKTKKDIAHLVFSFYDEVKKDKLIGPIFNKRIQAEEWPKHLDKMISFWTTVLLHEKSYRGNPFSKHIPLKIDKRHFDRWIELFNQTVKKNFEGPKALEAMDRAEKMRMLFESKLDYLKKHPNQFPIL